MQTSSSPPLTETWWVMGPRFTNQTLKVLPVWPLRAEWEMKWSSDSKNDSKSPLNLISQTCGRKKIIKALRVKEREKINKQHMPQRRNPTLWRTLPERLTGEPNLPAKTDGEKHCHMKPQRRSSGLLSTSNRSRTHSTGL